MSQADSIGLGQLTGTQSLKRKLNQNGRKWHACWTRTQRSGHRVFERVKRKRKETGRLRHLRWWPRFHHQVCGLHRRGASENETMDGKEEEWLGDRKRKSKIWEERMGHAASKWWNACWEEGRAQEIQGYSVCSHFTCCVLPINRKHMKFKCMETFICWMCQGCVCWP